MFQTYATIRIRAAIREGLRASDWVPLSLRHRVRAIDLAMAEFERRHRRTPSHAEVAAELSISQSEIDSTYTAIRYTNLLRLEPSEEHISSALWAYGVPGADDDLPDGLIDAVHQLPERDQIVVALYYWDRLTQNEISQVMGVSESLASQIRRHACDTLRSNLLNA